MADVKSSRPTVDREKTCPFLLRTFVRAGSFHPLAAFQTPPLPTAEEYQIYTWRDATLKELVTLLRTAAPADLRHPLARFSFRAVFADPARGRVGSKDLGFIHARDLVDPSASMFEDTKEGEDAPTSPAKENGHGHGATLEELRLVPGDYLSVAILIPNLGRAVSIAPQAAQSASFGIRGMGGRGGPPPVRGGRGGADGGWGGGLGVGRAAGPDGGHWRGRGGPPALAGRGAGRGRGRGRERDEDDRRAPGGRFGRPAERDLDRARELDRDLDRDRKIDRERDTSYSGRAPPPKREERSPVRDMDWGQNEMATDAGTFRKRRRSPSYEPRSRSRSRSPPRRRD
ncbi:hypothetical protein CALCODRAFT_480480 [Calocera cornea HHB12733]|uniref:Sin3 associated polypeptide p18 n=1 Tax=Calocera cornea HHB12733 TaxID=1353952 RepID=A0A165IPC1_9BASI|nr:hypothetical protein CALCODRAFT_480480 [Calocera cornea HHB12733]